MNPAIPITPLVKKRSVKETCSLFEGSLRVDGD
jgi:hypothetical protein